MVAKDLACFLSVCFLVFVFASISCMYVLRILMTKSVCKSFIFLGYYYP